MYNWTSKREERDNQRNVLYTAKLKAQEKLGLKSGDNLVMTGERINGHSGNTNTIKLEVVE